MKEEEEEEEDETLREQLREVTEKLITDFTETVMWKYYFVVYVVPRVLKTGINITTTTFYI